MKRFCKTSIIIVWMVCHTADLHAQPNTLAHHQYRMADSIAACYANHSAANIPLLASKLTAALATPEEKIRAIYYWVCHNIRNDYPAYLRNKHQQYKHRNNPGALTAWNRKFSQQVFATLREENKTVCTGYAYLIRALATEAGLTCVIINGYGRTGMMPSEVEEPNHSWNAIQLNHRWYLCDATWGSGAIDTRTGVFIPKFNDQYFLTSPESFSGNHYPSDTTWLLLSNKPTLKEFYKASLRSNSIKN